MPTPIDDRARLAAMRASCSAGLLLTLAGCGGEPSEREVKNARAFEALLTAVSLKNAKELEKDARLIDDRHAAGELSDGELSGAPRDHRRRPARRTGRAPRSGPTSSGPGSATRALTSSDGRAATPGTFE